MVQDILFSIHHFKRNVSTINSVLKHRYRYFWPHGKQMYIFCRYICVWTIYLNRIKFQCLGIVYLNLHHTFIKLYSSNTEPLFTSCMFTLVLFLQKKNNIHIWKIYVQLRKHLCRVSKIYTQNIFVLPYCSVW